MRRLAGIVFLASGLTAVAAPARAQVAADETPREHLLAVGVKVGIIPPILTVLEVVMRPRPKLALGLYGMYTSSAGLGDGAARISLGAEAVVEFREGRRNTPYLSFAYDYYHASPDANGNWETSHAAYVTAGYLVKSSNVELYFGSGLVFLLSDDVPPCTAFCINNSPPPVFPTLELGARFAFL